MASVVIVVIVACFIIGFGAHKLSGKDDTAVEQIAEAVLKDEAGIDIDFSKEDKVKIPE